MLIRTWAHSQLAVEGKEGRKEKSNCKQEDSPKMYLWKAVPDALLSALLSCSQNGRHNDYTLGKDLDALL